jgi:hypothetical protein
MNVKEGKTPDNGGLNPDEKSQIPEILEKVEEDMGSLSGMLYIAACCNKTRALDDRNLESLYALCECHTPPWKFKEFSFYISRTVDLDMESDDFKNLFESEDFVRYHTVLESVYQLVAKYIGNLGLKEEMKNPPISAADIKKSNDYVRDNTIALRPHTFTARTLVHVGAYLTAAGQYPDSWYQGNRARDDANIGYWKMCVASYKKIIQLGQESVGIEAMGTKDQVLEHLANN